MCAYVYARVYARAYVCMHVRIHACTCDVLDELAQLYRPLEDDVIEAYAWHVGRHVPAS